MWWWGCFSGLCRSQYQYLVGFSVRLSLGFMAVRSTGLSSSFFCWCWFFGSGSRIIGILVLTDATLDLRPFSSWMDYFLALGAHLLLIIVDNLPPFTTNFEWDGRFGKNHAKQSVAIFQISAIVVYLLFEDF